MPISLEPYRPIINFADDVIPVGTGLPFCDELAQFVFLLRASNLEARNVQNCVKL